MTHRTMSERINLERMRANVIEAAEQCNLVLFRKFCEPGTLERDPRRLGEQTRRLVYCDETAPVA